jgi:membrane-associated phospholipid phosphatase
MKHYGFVDYLTQGYVVLVGLLVLVYHTDRVPDWLFLCAVHIGGFVLIHLLVRACAGGSRSRWLDWLRHFYPLLLYTAFYHETGLLNRMFWPVYLDPILIRWEAHLFGCQPSLAFMQWLPGLAVSELFYAAYFSYYLMIAGIGVALFIRNRGQFIHFISVISLVFYACYVAYIFLPVIGPRVFFKPPPGYHLPAGLQPSPEALALPAAVAHGWFCRLMGLVYRWFEEPGAAFPSSHVAIAITTLYFSARYLPRLRWAHLALVVLLCLATVYCRYHYVLDVLAGVVVAVILIPLSNRLYSAVGGAGAQKVCS